MEPGPHELEELGLYDPLAADAPDRLRLLTGAFQLGATVEEVRRAMSPRFSLGPLLLDLALRPPGETMDLRDFAAGEPDPTLVRRIWSALGLPDIDRPVVRVTPDAADAVRFLVLMTERLGVESALGVARVVGSSMARLAETLADSFRVVSELPDLNDGKTPADVADRYSQEVPRILPHFLNAVGAIFRRQLINVSHQDWSTDAEQARVTRQSTVCFADLVGSTEALRAMSPRQVATMMRRFEEQVWELVAAKGGRVVKLIGDEAMFVLADPSDACQIGLDLIATSEYLVRIGMAHGTVVGLFGDYYGETVNLASRLVNLADPSTLVVSESVRHGAADRFTFETMAPQNLKGFAGPVPLHRVLGGGSTPPD